MSSFINYLLEANLCLLICGLFYFLVLRNETHFRFSRYYLIGSALLTVVLPLLHFSNPFAGKNAVPIVHELQTITLPELIVGAQSAQEKTTESMAWTWPYIAALIYLTVVIVLLTLFIYQLYQILHFRRLKRHFIVKHSRYSLVPTDGQLPTFAFFNLLFFDNTSPLSKTEKRKVIEHEEIHIHQRHSIDIIMLELVKILFWINPVAWWFRKSIQNMHEYLADQSVIKNSDADQYSSLLAKMALKQMTLPVGHHFNKSLTLKRIKMMKTPKTKFKTWKGLSLIPVISLIVIVLSCNDEVMNDVNTVMETTSQVEMPAELEDDLTELQRKYPQADFVYMETDDSNKDRLAKLQGLDPNSIALVRHWKERGRIGMIVNKNGPVQNIADVDGVYTIVEEPASPKGGYNAMYKQLAMALTYPEQARKQGIEGRVYVEFVVDTDGSLTNIEVKKGIGGGCDQAAIEAMKQLDPFQPAKQRGKAVKQRLVLPITFSLGGNNTGMTAQPEEIKADNDHFEINIKRDKTTVSGKVYIGDGQPLAGVNIVIASTTRGTVTDENGNFKLSDVKHEDRLVFSYVGYETQTLSF